MKAKTKFQAAIEFKQAFSLPSLFILLAIASPINAVPMNPRLQANDNCRGSNSQVQDIEDLSGLFHDVALVTKENRNPRKKADSKAFTSFSLESVQGRFWCQVLGNPPPEGYLPTKSELTNNYNVENATVAFEDNVILLNRHMFLDPNGQTKAKPENCFFEHISSGKLYRASPNVANKPLNYQDGKVVDVREDDIALVRLSKRIPGVSPIQAKDMVIDSPHPNGTPLTVVSNYAQNSPTGNPKLLRLLGARSKTLSITHQIGNRPSSVRIATQVEELLRLKFTRMRMALQSYLV